MDSELTLQRLKNCHTKLNEITERCWEALSEVTEDKEDQNPCVLVVSIPELHHVVGTLENISYLISTIYANLQNTTNEQTR